MRYYSSTFAKTTLVSDITAATTSISLGSVAGLPSQFPFTLVIAPDLVDEEVVEATALAGNIVTITRGVDGTSAQTHTAGTPVVHGVSARDFAETQTHMAASQAIHGLIAGSSVVGTNDTQTLTNKTLTSPTINTPTVSSGTFTSALAKTFTMQANAVGDISATIKAIAGQAGDLLDFLASDGTTVLAKFDTAGNLTVPSLQLPSSTKAQRLAFGYFDGTTDANGRVIIPHGLGISPTAVLLSPNVSTAIFVNIANDATNITVEARKLDGTNGLWVSTAVKFCWLALY